MQMCPNCSHNDLDGKPIKGDQFLSGRTDNTGLISWDVTAGNYAVEIGAIVGNIWGDEINHQVNSGETTSIIVTLGKLVVGLKDAAGNPVQGRWVGVYYQKQDISGNVVKGDQFTSGRTDNTGLISWDVTAGNYVVEVHDVGTLNDVPVQSGATTFTDGVSVNQK